MTDEQYDRLTRVTTWYEWDIESHDEHGDVLDHHHADRLKDLPPLKENERLVLIYNRGSEIDGVEEREWAYVVNGELPSTFDGGHSIPKRFRKELDAEFKALGL